MPDQHHGTEEKVTVTLSRSEAEALQRRERLNDEDHNWGEAEERGNAKIRTALDSEPRSSPEVGVEELKKALALMVLGWPYDDWPDDALYADPYEAEGLLKTGIDYSGEGYCVLTRDGARFVSQVLAATFTSPAENPTS